MSRFWENTTTDAHRICPYCFCEMRGLHYWSCPAIQSYLALPTSILHPKINETDDGYSEENGQVDLCQHY